MRGCGARIDQTTRRRRDRRRGGNAGRTGRRLASDRASRRLRGPRLDPAQRHFPRRLGGGRSRDLRGRTIRAGFRRDPALVDAPRRLAIGGQRITLVGGRRRAMRSRGIGPGTRRLGLRRPVFRLRKRRPLLPLGGARSAVRADARLGRAIHPAMPGRFGVGLIGVGMDLGRMPASHRGMAQRLGRHRLRLVRAPCLPRRLVRRRGLPSGLLDPRIQLAPLAFPRLAIAQILSPCFPRPRLLEPGILRSGILNAGGPLPRLTLAQLLRSQLLSPRVRAGPRRRPVERARGERLACGRRRDHRRRQVFLGDDAADGGQQLFHRRLGDTRCGPRVGRRAGRRLTLCPLGKAAVGGRRACVAAWSAGIGAGAGDGAGT